MSLLTVTELSVRFHDAPLLDAVNFRVEPRERVGLLGRNGAGKSTLLRIIQGEIEADSGTAKLAGQARVALLPQEVPRNLAGATFDVVNAGLDRVTDEHGDPLPEWECRQRVGRVLSWMSLSGNSDFGTLSSGLKRRVLLAKALVSDPDLLLLDEPTNHLDIDSIVWLEGFLRAWTGTFLFVTHDRTFLRQLATRILEVDRGRLFDWSCDYDTFLNRKEAVLEAEEKQNALFDKKLAREETWIRQGIKARRTRNEGRVRALEQMRRQRLERQALSGKARIQIDEGERGGRLVVEATEVSFAYENHPIVRNFTTTIMRGDKVGLIGPNGAGKTTLLRILLGKLAPDRGTVRFGTRLQVAYFDQLRESLAEDKSVRDNVADSADSVQIAGQSKHVIGYLKDFLFSAERANTLVRFLSGGERNRLMLAKLFAKPANVIVLDEPTNDLDAETLEMLEQRLVDYQGTLLVVSHDRTFLNNVVTSTIVFEPAGVKEYVGGYDDWVRQRVETVADPTAGRKEKEKPTRKPSRADAPRRLTYEERRELGQLPEAIERLETEIAELHTSMALPEFYRQSSVAIADEGARLKRLEAELAAAFERWEELESRA